MKKMIYCFMFMMAISNVFASTMVIAPSMNKKAMKMDLDKVDSLIVAHCDDGSKELQVKGDSEAAIDMQKVGAIKFLAGKNSEDKVSFFVNGEKRTYKISEIKSIKVRSIERAE